MSESNPGTIRFNTQSAPGGSLGSQSALPQMGVSGGGVGQAASVGSGASWFDSVGGMDAPDSNMPEFIAELTEPALANVRQARMWDGFVAARAGATMEEITKDTPWFSKVFGPTNYEIGAQTYTVLESVSNMEADLLNRMPELRKLPPEAMAQEFNRMTKEQMTGNIYADSLLQKNFMDRAGPLMDLHTKERVAWQQNELLRVQYASNSANSTAFQEISKRIAMLGGQRPADPQEAERLVQSQRSLLDGLAPSAYQTDESYKAAVTNFVRGAADRGEFYTLKFLEQNGVYRALGPDAELDLLAYVRGKKNEARTNYIDSNPGVAARMAQIQLYAAEGIGAEPSAAMIEEMNAGFMAATGSDEGLYSGGQLASIMAQSAGSHIRAQEAVLRQRESAAASATTDAAKRFAAEEDARSAVESFWAGTLSNRIHIPGVNKEETEALAYQSWQTKRETNPQAAAAALVQNANVGRGHVLAGVKDYYKTLANNVLMPEANDGAYALYQEWLSLRNTKAQRLDIDGNPIEGELTGATTASLYFGETNALFTQIQATMNGSVGFELAYKMAQDRLSTQGPGSLSARSGEEAQALEGRVANVLQQSFPKYMNYFGNRLGTSGRQAAARAIVRAVGESGGLLDTSPEGIMAALTEARLKYGGEDAGKYYWLNDTDDQGRPNQSVGAWLGFLDTKETGPAIEAAIDSELRKANLEPSPDLRTEIFRMRSTEKGEPVLHVMTTGPQGFKVVVVTGSTIREEYQRRAAAATAQKQESPIPMGYVKDASGKIVPSVSIQPKL